MIPISWILPRARAMFPDRTALIDGEIRHTFEQLGRRVDALVGGLKAKGVQQGDRVAILDVNSSIYAEAYYACAQAGMVLVPLNSRLSAPELRYILNDAGAKALLVSDAFFPTLESLRDSLPTVEHVLAYGRGPFPGKTLDYEAVLRSAQPATDCASVDLRDVAQIYYTSGTTGEPKGVCLTYRNMIASTLDALVGLTLSEKDIWLHGAPMFHLVDAWSIWAMPLIGASQVTLHYTPESFMRTVQATGATGTGLPPTLISMLANHPKIGEYDLSSLRLIMYGGSPTPLGVLRRAVQAVDTKYIHGYGITETSGITTLAHPDDFCVDGPPEKVAMTGSAGRAVPHIQLAISDDNGNRLGPHQVGEIIIGGPRVMECYWNKPKATKDVLRDGWYYSGDIGYLDEQQRLYVVDRKKDMIITGGENVYSVEVENLLSTHAAVLEVAVIGVPDERWNEAVKAVVVLHEGARTSEAELLEFCRGKIAGYKIPKSVDFSKEPLPKTGPGKIAKRRLRDPYWAGQNRAI